MTTIYDVGNLWFGMGQVQTCGGVKPVNRTMSDYELRRFVTLCLTCTINRVNPE